MRERRGAALVVVIAMLAVLSVLAISMARLTGLESQAAAVWVHASQARFAADAGVEFAIARLREEMMLQGFLGPTDSWYYGPNRLGVYEPLEKSQRPSFSKEAQEAKLPPSGSGAAASFRLKILDASGMIFIGGVEGLEPDDEVRRRAQVGAVLDRVSRMLGLDVDLGTRIMAASPRGGWRDKRQLLGILSEREFGLLADNVTCHTGWVDHDLAHFMAPPYPAAFDERARVPVNVNTASPFVLAAVVEGVAATVREPKETGAGSYGHETRRTTPVHRSQAVRFAQKLVSTREVVPLATWEDFRYFLLALVQSRDIDADQASAILAAVNPNALGNWFNHDWTLHRRISKADVAEPTLEFVFQPTGVFEIESEGRVTGTSEEILARARARAVVRILSLERHTTQNQFEANYEGSVYTTPAPSAIFARGDSISSADPAARFDGQVLLTGLEDSLAGGDVVFQAPCLGALSPYVETVRSTAPDGFLGTATESEARSDVGPGVPALSNLHYDGVFFDYNRMSTLIYPTQSGAKEFKDLAPSETNLPAREGRLEFWFKLDDWTSVLDSFPLVLATNPDTAASGLQTKIYGRGGVLIATRTYFTRLRSSLSGPRISLSQDGQSIDGAQSAEEGMGGAEPLGPPPGIPEDMEKTHGRAEISFEPAAHEWVHVSVSWKNYVELDLEVNGVVARGQAVAGGPTGYASVLPHNFPDLYFGPVYFDRAGLFRERASAGPTALPSLRHQVWTLTEPPRYTLAGLTIRDRYSDPATVPVPSRYPVAGPGHSAPVASFMGRLPLPPDAIAASIAWTEYETDSTFLDLYYFTGDRFLVASELDGRPAPLPWLAPESGGSSPNELVYLVRVTNQSPEPLHATPALDDITVAYLVPTSILTYEMGDRAAESSGAAALEFSGGPFAGAIEYVGTWFLPRPRKVHASPTVGSPSLGNPPAYGRPPEPPDGPADPPPVLKPPPSIPTRSGGPPPVWRPVRLPPPAVVTPKPNPCPYAGPPVVTPPPPVTGCPGIPVTSPPPPCVNTGPPPVTVQQVPYDPGAARTKSPPNIVTVSPPSGGGLYRAGQ